MRTTTSGADGTYKFADVAPGMYSVMAQKPGYSDYVLARVQVAAGQTAIADIVMAPKPTDPVTNLAPQGFWKRFAKAYWDDWHPAPDPPAVAAATAPGAEPAYRGDPPPESNPPYPFNIWPEGGTPGIGYNTSTQYPLTTALQTGPHGEWWKKANIQIYGWADLGMNISTSTAKPYGNAPAAYAQIPNSVQLDQLTLYIEKVPDTIQTDHFDWGFRITNLYGFDYRFTTSEGYFSSQLLTPKANGTLGNKYGYDPVMMYLDLYFPHMGQGTDVRIGRYISLPDIEAQLAPNNYSYSHSLTYTYDCYTQSGINATTKLSNHWTLQGGLSGGCEAAPWAKDATLTGNVCVAYTWTHGLDQVYTCANSINGGKYNYNNLSAYYFTWYHHFGHSKWHTDWETWYQYMKDTPNVNNPAAASLLIPNSNGAVCNSVTELTCFAPEWSTLNYVNYQISKKDFISIRNEYFDDLKGQRTGFKTYYTEHMISWNHWIGSTVVFRPEVRYDYSYLAPAFDNGTKKGQLMFDGDMIFFY